MVLTSQHPAPDTQHLSPKAQLRALGLRPRKRLSQAFLDSEAIADAIVQAAELVPEAEVLEVGPGLGVLTERLARAVRRVVAVEVDPRLAEALRRESASNVEVLTKDMLRLDPATLFTEPYVVVANLPYHISSPVLRHLLAVGPPFARELVVMVQAEVAERIAASPGQLSALAVSIQVQAQVEIVLHVPRSAFYPPPRVDSAVLRVKPRGERRVPREEVDAFVHLVQAGFKQPRKTLHNSLSEGLSLSRADTLEMLHKAGLAPGVRPQTLDLEDWVRLYRATL